MALQHFKVLTFDLGGTVESEHTHPDHDFRTLAELDDAVEAGR